MTYDLRSTIGIKNPRYTNRRYLGRYPMYIHIVPCEFQRSLMCLWQALKLWKMQLEVRSFNVTWRCDLWCHRFIVFLEMCQIVGWKAMANLVVLRAAVFSLSAKNLRGDNRPRPCAGERLLLTLLSIHFRWSQRVHGKRKWSEVFQEVVLKSVNKFINEKIQDLRKKKRSSTDLAAETEENVVEDTKASLQ